jgi:hypothetical protein
VCAAQSNLVLLLTRSACQGSHDKNSDRVASINNPSGNLTGMFFLTGAIESKRLGLLAAIIVRIRSQPYGPTRPEKKRPGGKPGQGDQIRNAPK